MKAAAAWRVKFIFPFLSGASKGGGERKMGEDVELEEIELRKLLRLLMGTRSYLHQPQRERVTYRRRRQDAEAQLQTFSFCKAADTWT